MKKYICISAALVAVLSCQKEAPQSPETKTFYAPATLEIPATKVTVGDKVYEWNEGDQILIRKRSNAFGYDALSALNDGQTSAFSGTIQSPSASEKYTIFFPHSAVTSVEAKSVIKVNLPNIQSGTYEDFDTSKGLGSCLFMLNSTPYTDEGDYRLSVKDSELSAEDKDYFSKVVFAPVTLKVMTPVIKLTVPEELGIKRITFEAYKDNDVLSICRAAEIDLQENVYTKAPSEYTSTANRLYITISRNGEIISGDVYITMYPDALPAATSSANKLYFKLEKGLGSTAKYAEITKSINETLSGSNILNLGTVPTDLKFIDPNSTAQASLSFTGTVPSTTPAE